MERKLAGENLAHSRANNIENVRRLVDGDPGVTLGIQVIHRRLEQGPLDPQAVLDTIAGITGCSTDLRHLDGLGYISPRATYDGLAQAAADIARAARRGGALLFASGHPRQMSPAYRELAAYARARGCEVIEQERPDIEHEGLRLALEGGVYMAMNASSTPAHTHSHRLMEDLLKGLPPIGLAVADHGFAGAALNLGIRTVCVMDTNDPGVAMAARLGAPVTVVPLNDNSPGEDVREIADIVIELVEQREGEALGSGEVVQV